MMRPERRIPCKTCGTPLAMNAASCFTPGCGDTDPFGIGARKKSRDRLIAVLFIVCAIILFWFNRTDPVIQFITQRFYDSGQ